MLGSVLVLLAVLHQPVYKSVCKCVWRRAVENAWVESHGQTAFAMCFCGQSVLLLLQLVSMAYSGKGIEPCIVGTYCVYLK